jgi:protease secretion system membrane fusion protein
MNSLSPLSGPQKPSEKLAPDSLSSDWDGYVKFGWSVLLGGIGVFLAWAIFAPLDKGVPVMGTVIVSGQRQTVQSPNAGVVEKILVKEGQQVAAGDILLRLQPQFAEAAAGASLAGYSLAILTHERLTAELAGRSAMGLPSSLNRYASEPTVQAQFRTQQQLLQDRLRTRAAEVAGFNEALIGLNQQKNSLVESRESKLRGSQLLEDQANRIRSLVDKGFASATMLDESELKSVRLQSEIAELQASLRRLDSQIAENKTSRERRESERQQEIKSSLLEAQRDIENYRGQLGSAEVNMGYTDIKAPVAGLVLGLGVTTPGAVLAPGAKLMDIVPSQRDLVVEAQVPVNLIDQVRGDLQVELMFSAFQQNKTPRLTGRVTTVGADRITDQRTGMPYYPVNVSIDAKSMVNLGVNELRPGMPVDVFIKTGERTFASYIAKPLVDKIKISLTEE